MKSDHPGNTAKTLSKKLRDEIKSLWHAEFENIVHLWLNQTILALFLGPFGKVRY